MNVEPSFLNNCNIMILVLVVELIIASIIFFVGKVQKCKKVKKIGRVLLKQGFLTLIIFNSFNISFSAGISWRFNDNDN